MQPQKENSNFLQNKIEQQNIKAKHYSERVIYHS